MMPTIHFQKRNKTQALGRNWVFNHSKVRTTCFGTLPLLHVHQQALRLKPLCALLTGADRGVVANDVGRHLRQMYFQAVIEAYRNLNRKCYSTFAKYPPKTGISCQISCSLYEPILSLGKTTVLFGGSAPAFGITQNRHTPQIESSTASRR